jgi:hypothetical protein
MPQLSRGRTAHARGAAPAALSPPLSRAARPLAGLLALAIVTVMFVANRTERYSEEPKSLPPAAQRIGDDFVRVAELSRDPRSISLLVGQALYDVGPERFSSVLLPAEPQELTAAEGPRMPSGRRADVIREGQIELLAGVRPEVSGHEARLTAVDAEALASHPRARDYPMGVVAVSADDDGPATYALVADETGERVFVIPAELLAEVAR